MYTIVCIHEACIGYFGAYFLKGYWDICVFYFGIWDIQEFLGYGILEIILGYELN